MNFFFEEKHIEQGFVVLFCCSLLDVFLLFDWV